MNQTIHRQLARLEKLEKQAKPLHEATRLAERKWLWTVQGAASHAAILVFLIRYGNPKIEESLSQACQRVSESRAWNECCERFPSSLRLFEPHTRGNVFRVGLLLRHAVISNFPGIDEKEKLSTVFASAPPWLVWFTFGDYTAKLLGLTLPDLSSVTGFARSETNFRLWWGLPREAFECRPWPNGPENERLARTDLDLLRPATQPSDRQMTPREQKRASTNKLRSPARIYDWPNLPKAEFLAMPFEIIQRLPQRPSITAEEVRFLAQGDHK